MRSAIEAGMFVLAGFGLVMAVLWLLARFWSREHHRAARVGLIVVFRDKESITEGFLRAILNLRGLGRCNDCVVVAIDAGSADGTPLILERLRRRYQGLKVGIAPDSAAAFDLGLALAQTKISVVCDARGDLDVGQTMQTIFGLLCSRGVRSRAR